MKKWYCVCTSVYDDHTTAAVVDCKEAEDRPESTSGSTRRCDVYCDWYDSMAQAKEEVRRALRA